MLIMKALIIKSFHVIEDRSTAYKKEELLWAMAMAMTPNQWFNSGTIFNSTRSSPLRKLCRGQVFETAGMVILLQVLLATFATVGSSPTVYDQRQTGKTNVRVELKDAVIVAIGDGELGGDYEYNYDYSDLTIKPSQPTPSTGAPTTSTEISKSTTPKVTTTSTTAASGFNLTQNAAVVLEAENNSIIFPANAKPGSTSAEPIKITASTASGGYKPDQIPVLVLQEVHRPNKFLPVKTVEKQGVSAQNEAQIPGKMTVISPKELPTRHCAPGFSLDDQNRCKRIRRPTREKPQLPLGLRFDHSPLIRS